MTLVFVHVFVVMNVGWDARSGRFGAHAWERDLAKVKVRVLQQVSDHSSVGSGAISPSGVRGGAPRRKFERFASDLDGHF